MFYQEEYRKNYENQTPQEIWDAAIPESGLRAARFKELLGKETRVLEIGCSTGNFLDGIKGEVKSVTGIELTKECISFAQGKGITVLPAVSDVPDESFDLVVMFHVLEHLDDPIAYLKAVGKKLSHGGKIVIEVPNVNDILVSVYKIPEHLDFYWEVAHNWYFSYSTLSQVLVRAGFTFTIYPLQRYDLSNHMRWMQTGKPGGHGYYKEFPGALLMEYEKTLKTRWICDTIYAVAHYG
jgi:SAM-dependent methyltransferase